MRRTDAPPGKRFKWHYVPRNRGARLRLIADSTVYRGTTACRPKAATRLVTHRASHVAAKTVVLHHKVRLFLEQLIDKMFVQRGRIVDCPWRRRLPPLTGW